MISFEKYNLTEDQSLPAELNFGLCILYFSYHLLSISSLFFFKNIFDGKLRI